MNNSLETFLALQGQLEEARKGLFVWEDSGDCSHRRECDREIISRLLDAGCVQQEWRECAYSGEYHQRIIGPGELRYKFEEIIFRAEYAFGLGDVSLHESFFQGPGSDGDRYHKFLLRNGYTVIAHRYDGRDVPSQVYRNDHPSKGAMRFVRWLRD